jgi:hypothetical protein
VVTKPQSCTETKKSGNDLAKTLLFLAVFVFVPAIKQENKEVKYFDGVLL